MFSHGLKKKYINIFHSLFNGFVSINYYTINYNLFFLQLTRSADKHPKSRGEKNIKNKKK